MTSPEGTTHCVVLASGPHREEIAPPLAAAIEARRWQGIAAPDPLAALAELCLLERAGSIGQPWGADPVAAPVLVVVEPTGHSHPQLDEMLSALERYLPRVAVWSFAQGALRRQVRDGADDGEGHPFPAAPASTETEITREEIAMLLDAGDRKMEDEP